MKLRPLEIYDAPFMLEWMHDINVTEKMRADFSKKNITDCNNFILNAMNSENDLHLAVVNDLDEYMGTVSLKDINREDMSAEFAIILRTIAMGKGYSMFAMKEIIRVGFEKLSLDKIYWCVAKNNLRAIKFYDKNKYKRINPKYLGNLNYDEKEIEAYIWYLEQRNSYKL